MKQHSLSLPLRVPISKNKNWSLNINQYRNAHYQVLSKAKNNYEKLVYQEVKNLPFMNRIGIRYSVFAPNKRRFDVNNIVSIVDKFFLDGLVKAGKLTDDDYRHVPETWNRFGGIDPQNPRVEIDIYYEN